MLSRTTVVLLVTHALMMPPPLDGVAAPTAPDMVSTNAPAISTVIGFRKRPIESGRDDIDALLCGDPSRNCRDEVGVLSPHRGSNGAGQRQIKWATWASTFDLPSRAQRT